MRRVAVALLAVVAVVSVASALRGAPAQSADTFRVDAIFDTAKGVIPGQLVKIAGARAGTIDDVVLTPDYKARVQMTVDQRFSPFRADAHCEIQPEGLISENFVQCDPGSPEEAALQPSTDNAPTVPVENTSAPVSITDLFRIFQAPVRQRFAIIAAALGNGVAGRGEDLNAVLRRANPTLALVRKITRRLARQRREIGTLVDASDTLIAELARRRTGVQDFIEQAARVTAQTAARRERLAAAIHNLPPLLDEVEPALERVRTLARDGAPVLADLRATAPSLSRLLRDVAPLSTAARPALRALGRTATQGRAAVKSATPVVKLLRQFAAAALPTGQLLDPLLVSLRDRGFVEGLLSFVYHVTAATARFDQTSHILPAHLVLSSCSQFATQPVAGCSANYNQGRAQRKAKPQRKPAARRPAAPQTRQPPAVEDLLPELEAPDVQLPPVTEPLRDAIDSIVGGAPQVAPLEDLAGYLFG